MPRQARGESSLSSSSALGGGVKKGKGRKLNRGLGKAGA